jgi:hypothetical protein
MVGEPESLDEWVSEQYQSQILQVKKEIAVGKKFALILPSCSKALLIATLGFRE